METEEQEINTDNYIIIIIIINRHNVDCDRVAELIERIIRVF